MMNRQAVSKRKKKGFLESVFFTVPCLVLVLIMFYIPSAMGVFYSFTKWNGISKEPIWIGIENYKQIFSTSSDFLKSLGFTFRYTICFMLITNVCALLLAVALTRKILGATVFRGLFFVPYIMSLTIVGFIWKFIFSSGFNALYKITQWAFLDWSWLGSSKYAFWSIVIVGAWQALGFYMVLYIAGLQSLSSDVLEAATVDGANSIQKFFLVTLPLLRPSVITCIFLSLTNGLKVFDIILALTKGGPGDATYSVTLNIYREAFQRNQYGYGSAKAVLYFFIVLLITELVMRFMNRGDE